MAYCSTSAIVGHWISGLADDRYVFRYRETSKVIPHAAVTRLARNFETWADGVRNGTFVDALVGRPIEEQTYFIDKTKKKIDELVAAVVLPAQETLPEEGKDDNGIAGINLLTDDEKDARDSHQDSELGQVAWGSNQITKDGGVAFDGTGSSLADDSGGWAESSSSIVAGQDAIDDGGWGGSVNPPAEDDGWANTPDDSTAIQTPDETGHLGDRAVTVDNWSVNDNVTQASANATDNGGWGSPTADDANPWSEASKQPTQADSWGGQLLAPTSSSSSSQGSSWAGDQHGQKGKSGRKAQCTRYDIPIHGILDWWNR